MFRSTDAAAAAVGAAAAAAAAADAAGAAATARSVSLSLPAFKEALRNLLDSNSSDTVRFALKQISKICRQNHKYDTLPRIGRDHPEFARSFWQCQNVESVLCALGYAPGRNPALYEIEEPHPVFLHAAADLLDAELDRLEGVRRLRIGRWVPEAERHVAADVQDAARGCFYGALVGDATGAVLEFTTPTLADADAALLMPGGGAVAGGRSGLWRASCCFNVAPGQVTDDGELALCLAHGLVQGDGAFDLDAIAERYRAWYRSGPFDVGNTCSNAFRGQGGQPVADEILQRSLKHNMQSKANGAMMRAAPLGLWAHRLGTDAIARVVRAECRLSHPNPAAVDANVAYVLALAHLVSHPGDRVGAFGRAAAWCRAQACAEVQEWMQSAERGELVPYSPLIGFVRIAFVHAMRHLLLGTSYEDAIRETLAGGGDTDTNAAIVGAMVGAAGGASHIPPRMLDAMLTCRPRHSRPEFLQTRLQAAALAERLMAVAPHTLPDE